MYRLVSASKLSIKRASHQLERTAWNIPRLLTRAFSETPGSNNENETTSASADSTGTTATAASASLSEDIRLVDAWREQNALDTFINQKIAEADAGLKGGIDACFRLGNAYEKALADGFLGGESLLQDIRAFVLLENPVLRKYNFQPTEFLTGANQALREVRAALCSQSFYEYANNISTDSKESDLLKSTMHPTLYTQCVEALREMESAGLGYTHLPANIHIHKSFVVDIDVRVVSSDEVTAYANDNEAFKSYASEEESLLQQHNKLVTEMKEAAAAAKETFSAVHPSVADQVIDPTCVADETSVTHAVDDENTTAAANAKHSAADFMLLQEELVKNITGDADSAAKAVMGTVYNAQFTHQNGNVLTIPSYPEGSVVVDIKVKFIFEPLPDDNDSNIMKDQKAFSGIVQGRSAMEWVISGCLSGQEDLEYKITSFGNTFDK